MKCNFAGKILRKTKKILRKKSNGDVIIKSSKWMKKQSNPYIENMQRELKISVETNAENRVAYSNLSRAVEMALNELAEKETHDFKNILVIKNPYQYSPLCALALFQTKKPYRVKVTVKGKTEDCDVNYIIPANTIHRVPIMGLYADYENTIDIELLNKKGKTKKKKTFKMYVEPLKGKSSTIKVSHEISKADYLYGLTLVYGGDDGIFPYAFDKNGDIRFAFALSPKTYGFQPISKGRFLFLNKSVTRLTFTNTAATQLFEVDQMGRFHKTFNIEKGAHHEFLELKNGNLVTSSNSIEGETYEDTVIEVDRKTGAVLNEIKIKDYIDPKYVDTPDWAHLNSIEYNTDEKTVMVNLRNLHAVVKINYEKKELLWILGHPIFWENSTVADKVLTPVGDDMKWFFQAHAAYFIDEDLDGNPDTRHMIIYDNHAQKRVPVSYYDNDNKSYVSIYTINEKLGTVSLFKAYPCERSKVRSNGIYAHKAGRVMGMNGKLLNSTISRNSTITEFDYATEQVLNQYAMNYGFYRAYGFQFEIDEMVKRMNMDKNYMLGEVYGLDSCEQTDISQAKSLPEPILEEIDKTEKDRRERLARKARENPDFYVDPEEDMARIKAVVEEDVLYVYSLDHFLERVYLVGDNHTYFRDYTDTKQERPEYFARAGHTDAIPLKDLEEDTYEVYFKHSIGLYKSKYYVKITKK